MDLAVGIMESSSKEVTFGLRLQRHGENNHVGIDLDIQWKPQEVVLAAFHLQSSFFEPNAPCFSVLLDQRKKDIHGKQ